MDKIDSLSLYMRNHALPCGVRTVIDRTLATFGYIRLHRLLLTTQRGAGLSTLER